MDRIYVVIQNIKINDDPESWEYDFLSAWSTHELASAERERLRKLGYRGIHVYPVKFNE